MLRVQRKWTLVILAALVSTSLFLYRRHDSTFYPNGANGGGSDLGDKPASPVNQPLISENQQEEDKKPVFLKGVAKPAGESYTRMLVMGRLENEDVSWIDSGFMNVNTTIYVVDDPNSENKIPKNKGREAMVYLTYIIDHYDDLADTTLFFHPHLGAWHNNVLLDLNGATTVKRLSSARVAREGYVNARCHHDPGCPDWLHIDRPKEEWDLEKKTEERFFTSKVWRELHGNDIPIPKAVSQPCCAQFAVSRDRIRARSKEEYESYRKWLLNTNLEDTISGRIMEYSWQFIFTGEAEFCPAMNACYCDGYGICFGGEQELQGWLDMLKSREKADEAFKKLVDESKQDSDEARDAQRTSQELNQKLESWKQEAYRNGDDPRNRAKEAGREWKDGDGY